MSQQASMPIEGARPTPDTMGPMPGVNPTTGAPAQGGSGNFMSNLMKMQDFSSFLGDTTEEREKNAAKFAAMVKDVGNVGRSMADSTLMQRMMTHSMGGTGTIVDSGGGGQSISPIPRTFDPAAAGNIVNQLGFK